jgi:hypothetical protein
MPGWAGSWQENPTAGVTSGDSGVEVVGQGLVEFEVGDGVGLGGVEDRCLIEEPCEEIALRWSARGREGRGFVGEALTPRKRALRGGPGSRWRRMAETTGGSVRNARILISAPQAGHNSGSTS